MQDNDKVYSFTITLIEFVETIPTLWNATKDFMRKHPEHVAKNNAMHFVSDDGNDYNMCHCTFSPFSPFFSYSSFGPRTVWSNFEIADLDFWRSPAYQAYFEHLDATGGFYYERWGDAPIHSLAASLLLPKEKIHFFAPIGYEHAPHNHCPLQKDGYSENHCQCGPQHSFGKPASGRDHTCSLISAQTLGPTRAWKSSWIELAH
jgi:alpha 1,2-mannosyltransferase